MSMGRFEVHAHTDFSNIRLIDSINKPERLINRAVEIGLSGICITDHECISSHIRVNQMAKKLLETNPDFKIGLGNEIYLCEDRSSSQKYFHFILVAKDKEGHRLLRELSSDAWLNSYVDRRLERVVTVKDKMRELVLNNPGHLIATTACLGGELPTLVNELVKLESVPDTFEIQQEINNVKKKIQNFIRYCLELFGKDFYIEIAPGKSADQITFNKRIIPIAKREGVKLVIGTDSHYLTKEDRYVHKAYLNSKEEEREVDDFYQYTYLMTDEECAEILNEIYDNDHEFFNELIENSKEIYEKISFYDLTRKQVIPDVPVKNYLIDTLSYIEYPTIKELLRSEDERERYWINQCIEGLVKFNKLNNEYLERLETEAHVIKFIGNKLEDCLFSYFNTLQHYINLFWECGSILGPGRGSAVGFLSNYLMGITQIDPIEHELPYWRFLNLERAELPDIDIDLAPSKRPLIFSKIREERGELGLVQVATFGTEGTKSAILTACRGYRSESYPEGIDVDAAQYISSLIPSERGFLWPLKDVVNGNVEKGRKQISTFIREVEQYPGLLDIMFGIEGIINKRSSHAAGVILFNENPYDFCGIMRTPSGDIITSYELHDDEAAGMTKYDFLLTEISDKIIKCVELLQKDGVIEEGSLKDTYDKYLHPSKININDSRIWDALGEGSVLDVFQFSTGVGLAVAKKIKPRSIFEMTDANSLMRLMAEDGQEMPQDRYARFKLDISQWYKEMDNYGLSKEQQKVLEKYYLNSYGTCPQQEELMLILMDPDIANFTLAEANAARKIVGKKQMNKIPELKEKLFMQCKDSRLAEYVWTTAINPQMGYAFSRLHSTAYSWVGVQTLYLATNFNPIYWNTACLIVNSGSVNKEENDSTDYGKVASAIAAIQEKGIKISLADINHSDFEFTPDIKNNQILFGLKSILNVGSDLVNDIITNRPYNNLYDYMEKVPTKKQSMRALIKAGAFDAFVDRKTAMGLFVWDTCDKKKRLTLQNFNGLVNYNLIPESLDFERRVFNFNKYLKTYCKVGDNYVLDKKAETFFLEHFYNESYKMIDNNVNLPIKIWEKIYSKQMDNVRDWLKNNQEDILYELNKKIFYEDWEKATDNKNNISAWEMEAMCFYYHEHELINADKNLYGISNFYDLSPTPVVESTFKRKNAIIPIYKIEKIVGTCIAKNKIRSTVTLLTTDGVVTVKFSKEYFAMFDKQISEKQKDGKKKVMEKSWFNRGSMIMVQGYRREDDFVAKTYTKTPGHTLYKITDIKGNGELSLIHERYKSDNSIEEEEIYEEL
ncbi:MAG: DNA polymerase III subunit alpha [Bacilli bacterium]|nr:DNA polymerase III subunit alpha [Bacilli bacterium]